MEQIIEEYGIGLVLIIVGGSVIMGLDMLLQLI